MLELVSLGSAVLNITTATRAAVSGELKIGQRRAALRGKIKPGNPSVLTLTEVAARGHEVSDGLHAILYLPPWWPNVDYDYDLITGTLVIGEQSALAAKKLQTKLVTVTGAQSFA
ncbi:MAG: hypothetical protein WAU68_03840 [Vitreimonas sp.]